MEKRYFSSSLYNMTRVVNKLAELVEQEGGEVERHAKDYTIYTRGYDERIYRLQDQIERIEKGYIESDKTDDVRKTAIERLTKELKALEQDKADAPVIETRFVTLTCDLWIRFVIDGYIYEIDFEDNPFFPDHYCKVPVGEKNSKKYYRDKIECEDKFYYPDDMFEPVAKDDTIDASAKCLLKYLKTRKTSD